MLPAWVPPLMVNEWNRYLDAVWAHEQGHENLAMQAGSATVQAIEALPPAGSCRELNRQVQATGQAVVAHYALLQDNYDIATGHGALQGAVLR